MVSITERKIWAAVRALVLLSAWGSFVAAVWLWALAALPFWWAAGWLVISLALAAGMDTGHKGG